MIDKIDRQILILLQEDGRMANKEISYRIGLVPSATSERLRKLKERGYITSFEARLNYTKLGCAMTAFIFVRTGETAGCWDTGKALAEIPEVQEVFNVAGEDCYMAKVRTRDTQSLGRLIREKIGAIESVISTRTTIVLETYKETCRLPLELELFGGDNGKNGNNRSK